MAVERAGGDREVGVSVKWVSVGKDEKILDIGGCTTMWVYLTANCTLNIVKTVSFILCICLTTALQISGHLMFLREPGLTHTPFEEPTSLPHNSTPNLDF